MAIMDHIVKPGDKFNRLTACEPINGGKFWICNCECGKTTKASRWHLLKGHRKSCGCRKKTPQQNYRCYACKISKARTEFYIRKNGVLFYQKCKECHKQSQRLKEANRRLKALNHYSNGNPQCTCCGEKLLEFLHLDHKGGWGAKHRKEIIPKMSIWKWLEKNNYPELPFQILCANCNLSLNAYGYCPHSQNRNIQTIPAESSAI